MVVQQQGVIGAVVGVRWWSAVVGGGMVGTVWQRVAACGRRCDSGMEWTIRGRNSDELDGLPS